MVLDTCAASNNEPKQISLIKIVFHNSRAAHIKLAAFTVTTSIVLLSFWFSRSIVIFPELKSHLDDITVTVIACLSWQTLYSKLNKYKLGMCS